jgi:hypothetical protein
MVFFTNEWEAIYPHHYLHSLASMCSDHASLLLKTDGAYIANRLSSSCVVQMNERRSTLTITFTLEKIDMVLLPVILGSCSRF